MSDRNAQAEGLLVRGNGEPRPRTQERKPALPVIPVVFLPGIMGSNLRVKDSCVDEVKKRFEAAGRGQDYTDRAWQPPSARYSMASLAKVLITEARREDSEPVRLGKTWESYGPKLRQTLLNPETIEVDDRGFLPRFMPWLRTVDGQDANTVARARGWGTVHWDSYGLILEFLELSLNPYSLATPFSLLARRMQVETCVIFGHAYRFPKAVMPSHGEVAKAVQHRFPVHAMGYNWAQSNLESAKDTLKQIDACIQGYQRAGYACRQVILVTHSMGGLVARVASQLDAKNTILGVVHGVMPAIGAPVAYRRMVGGVEYDKSMTFGDLQRVVAMLGGQTAAETTPVMANAPGCLELLPSHLYPPRWLRVERDLGGGEAEPLFSLPDKDDPYSEIYKERNAWWRLVDPKLLNPAKINYGGKDGASITKAWDIYCDHIEQTKRFHSQYLKNEKFKVKSFAFYGINLKTVATIRWRLPLGADNIDWQEIRRARCCGGNGQGMCLIFGTRQDAKTGKIIDGKVHFGTPWRVTMILQREDGLGDGTVPVQSGSAPAEFVQGMTGFHSMDHQNAFKVQLAQTFTLIAICKLAGAQNMQ